MTLARRLSALMLSAASLLGLSACSDSNWNDPHPENPDNEIILYSSFSERPKHLDPARAYSADESTFIDQIYEPPLQYHYLKRPYQLIPLTLTEMPQVQLLDEQNQPLADDAEAPAYSLYTLKIQPGIKYQPHPAFARRENGEFTYQFADASQSAAFTSLKDFTETGSQELIADDYIYQINRLADPKRLAPLRGLLSQYIVGMADTSKAITEARKQLKENGADDNTWLDLRQFNMEGVKKIDDHTFTIKLKGKYPQFNYWLAFHFFAPIPWAVDRFYHLPGLPDKNITLDWHPVGTGAFMMTENNPNSEIILSKNPNYRGELYPSEGEAGDVEKGLLADAGKTMPFIDKAIFRLEKEAIPVWTKFLQGYYDRSGISSDSFDQAVKVGGEGITLSEEMIEKGITLNKSVQPSTYYLGFNMLDPVIGGYSEKQRKLRQAIAIAYNQEEFISIFLNGRGETAMSPVPPGIFGYQSGKDGINDYVFDWQQDANDPTSGKAVRKPLEVAKRLLAEAGYPDGRDAKTGKPLVLNLDTISGSGTQARMEWTKKQFKKLNLQLNIRGTDYNRFKDKMENGNAQIYFWGWLADYPDPENFLFLLYGKNAQIDSKSGVNSANYKSAEYDRLFKKMQLMENSPERAEIIDQMLDILHRDTPWATGFHGHSYALNNSWVKNTKPHGISKTTFKYRRLDTELRREKQQQWNQPVLWPLGLVLLITLIIAVPGYQAYKRRQTRVIDHDGDHKHDKATSERSGTSSTNQAEENN